MLRWILPAYAAAALMLGGCASPAVSDTRPVAGASARGMVSAADPRAAAAGAEMLRKGGSAADAAIATAIALTVVEPQSSGIGGGGFLVYHDAGARGLSTYDGRETAPVAATPRLFLGTDGKPMPFREAVPGGRSVGVPGNFRMFALAHEKHGRLPWAALFEPAIRLARDGFEVTPRMREMIAPRTSHVGMTPGGRAQLLDANGEAKAVGTRIRNPDLAALLESVAQRGADYYYTGAPAQALVRTVTTAAKNPSAMTMGDMASYDAKQRDVLCGTYRGHRICGMGPPSSGATTVFAILKQLERFDLKALGKDSPEAWHLIAESMRLAYADREAYLGDPDFVRVPAAGLMDPAYLAKRSALISPERAMAEAHAGTPAGAPRAGVTASTPEAGTSHLAAVDRDGNVASLTSTIEGPFGSGLTVNGYFLNNELTDFNFVPDKGGVPSANRVEGGKRPRSSMSPSIVYAPDGSVRLAVGAAGGVTIIAQVAKAIIGVIDWDLSAQEAIALPQLVAMGNNVRVERGTALEAMIPLLTAKGHDAVAAPPMFKANAIEWKDGRWVGAADPRSEGAAVSE